MFIKKDLRKIPTILEEAVDCKTYDDENDESENDNGNDNGNDGNKKKKRAKREEPIRMLKLGRRKQEFDGCVKVLCQPAHVPKLKHLSVLNLYDCDIHDLTGFGPMFGEAAPNLETLNLGRNPLSKGIPAEFSKVRSLKHLWLDDCKLSGALPRALLNLPNLESLRLPNNKITHLDIGGVDTNITKSSTKMDRDDGEEYEYDDSPMNDVPTTPTAVIPLNNLKILCLDRNLLGSHGSSTSNSNSNSNSGVEMDTEEDAAGAAVVMPSNLADWTPNLEELLLRHNKFRELGVQKWPSTLKILHVSSNQLENLDELVVNDGGSPSLTHLYANGNRLNRLPEGILEKHPKLQRLVVSHNPPLEDLPEEVWKKLGLLPAQQAASDDATGVRDDDASSCEILWQPNPNLSAPAGGSTGAEDTTMNE
eukprot:jgi/Psemu1/296777/fgenesh1_pm.198_\